MLSKKVKSNILLLIVLTILPFLKGFAQTDDQSNGAYYEVYINNAWENLDKNKTGQFSESENKRIWKALIVKNSGHNFRKVEQDIVPTQESIIAATIDYFVAHLK